jgi:hypothetical protein
MQLNNKVQDTKPERWITQIQNGIVTLVQRIAADAFVIRAHDLPAVCANDALVIRAHDLPAVCANDALVIRAHDLPAVCANEEFVTDEQARAIAEAILYRLK